MYVYIHRLHKRIFFELWFHGAVPFLFRSHSTQSDGDLAEQIQSTATVLQGGRTELIVGGGVGDGVKSAVTRALRA